MKMKLSFKYEGIPKFNPYNLTLTLTLWGRLYQTELKRRVDKLKM